jgi:SHS2 domain-containing protein
MPYEINDTYTTSDIGLSVTGRDLKELFIDSVFGLVDIMADREQILDNREIPITLDGDNLEDLYHNWLSEIIYIKDAEYFLPRRIIMESFDEINFGLKAILHGENIDPERHGLKVDVKAVTYYNFSIKKENNLWHGEVVFDI